MARTFVEKLNLQKYEKVALLDLPEGSDYLAELADYLYWAYGKLRSSIIGQ